MNKSNLTGWKDVYSFTLIQTLKSKAYIISFVILLVLMMVSMPIASMVGSSGSSNSNGPSPVKKVYVNNETALKGMDFEELLKDEKFSHIVFEDMEEDYNVVSKRIEEKEKEAVILTISEKEDGYSLHFAKAAEGPVSEGSVELLSNAVIKQFQDFKIRSLGIKPDQMDMINAQVKTSVSMTDVSGNEIVKEDTSISFAQYWFIYGILFIVMMVNIMASTQIAYSIVTEKSSRVIEYLLISVRPLAIMVGKILSMLTAVMLQVISMIVVLLVSDRISGAFFSSNGKSVLSQFLPKDVFLNLNTINIVFCLILIVVGMIFYANLAGLIGATVSRLEEINEALSLFSFINLAGVYIGMGAASVLMGPGVNGYVTFAFLFPLSSPFLLPGAVLIGKAGLPIVAAAIVLQIISIILLFKFTAKVYETLILHSGIKIKIKELINISRTA